MSASGNTYQPEPLEADDFQSLTESSPFTRSLNLSDSLALTGVAWIGGDPLVTLWDKESKEAHVISKTPNERGWSISDVEPGSDLETLSAKIRVNGGEMVTVRFEEKQLRPEANGPTAPTGQDTRPKPTKEERRKYGEYVKKRMGEMTEAQRKRVGEIMREKMKANPDLSDRQKGETFSRILDWVANGERK